MSKMLKKNSLFGQQPLLAMSLAASVIAFGCTTDRSLGNGRLGGRSGVPTAPTSGVTSGSETEPTLPPPMTSSYSRPATLPKAGSVRRLSADEAAQLMAQHRPQYRVLGPVSPGLSGNVYRSAGLVTGQWQNPAMITNPQLTINSSITSAPTAVIANGDDAALLDASAISGSLVLGNGGSSSATGTNAALTAGPTNQTVGSGGAPVFAPGAATGTAASTLSATTIAPIFANPTNTAINTTPGAFAGGTFTPTTAAAGPAGRTIGTAAAPLPSMQTTTTATGTSRSMTTRASARSANARATATTTHRATATAPVRIVSSGQGVTITNQH